jgi:mannosyltransferase
MIVVGGYQAGERQLWEDELATWHAATLPYADFVRLLGHIDLALGPYYVLMQGWTFAFGDSPLSLRGPSIIAMGLAAGLVTDLGRRLFNPRVGLMAGLLFVAVPGTSRYAQEARPYAIAILLAAAATILLLRAIERPTWPRWLAYGAAVIGLGLAHLVALTLLAAHFFVVRYTARQTDRMITWRWLGAVVLTVAVSGPFVLLATGENGAISWIKVNRQSLRALPANVFGSGAVALVIVALALLGMYIFAARDGVPLTVLASWAIVPPLLMFLTEPVLHLFYYRYLLFTLPAWVLLAAAGLDEAVHVVWRARQRLAIVTAVAMGLLVIAGVAVLGIGGQAQARADPLPGYPDYRAAGEIIRANLQPGDAIAFGGAQDLARRGMAYEDEDQLRPRDAFQYVSAESRGWFVASECPDPQACLGGTTRVWLVNTSLSGDYFAEMTPAVASLLRSQCTVVEAWPLAHLHLVLLAVKGLPATAQSAPRVRPAAATATARRPPAAAGPARS